MADEHEFDNLGRCVHHPFVQLRVVSKRTGEWKTLLDACPLCDADGQSACGSAAASVSRKVSMNESDLLGGSGSSRDLGGSSLRVSFRGEGDGGGGSSLSLLDQHLQGSSSRSSLALADCAGSVASAAGRSALKAPRYKVCKDLMMKQLDESDRVTKMSEDMDISDDEDSFGEPEHDLSRSVHCQSVSVPDQSRDVHDDEPRQFPSVSLKRIEPRQPQQQPQQQQKQPPQQQPQKQQQPPPSPPQRPVRRSAQSNGGTSGLANHRPGDHSSVRSSPVPSGRVRRRQPEQDNDHCRPDPEEFPCGASVSSQSSGGSGRRRAPPPRRGGSRRSQQSERSRQAQQQEQLEQQQHFPPAPPPRPCYDMVIQAPAGDFRDDVSAVTFSTGSVAPAQSPPRCEVVVEGEEGDQPIDTNEYDERGRCVRHPHVKLRKKKMFGKKWKVLMSACPDCCVDELKRIRLKDEHGRKEFSADLYSQGSGCQQLNKDDSNPRSQGDASSVGSSSRSSSRHVTRSPMPPPPPPRSPVKASLSGSTTDTASLTSSASSGGASFKSKSVVSLPSGGREGGGRVRLSLSRNHQVAPYTEPPRPEGPGEKGPAAPDGLSGDNAFVSQMRYIDETGLPGLYTGQVDSRFLPSGRGSLRYDNGALKQGQWRDGRLGSGDQRARRQQQQQQRRETSSRGRARSESRTRQGEGGRPRSRSRSHARTRSESRCRVDRGVAVFE